MMDDTNEVRRKADNLLIGHGPMLSLAARLDEVSESLTGEELPDRYGVGEYLQSFEAELADMFGMEAAVFMPSGTMAQQIALRIWSEQTNNMTVAMHPLSHPETGENHGYQFLHGLHRLQFGVPEFVNDRTLTKQDFETLGVKPGVVLIELPYRPLGGQLPSWDELVAISSWCRDLDIPFHMDGARIWQCTSYYNKSLAEIAALFDSVYVSFYKDIGGIAGCMLMGPKKFIAESKVWQRRHGGNLPDQSLLVAAARLGMQRVLPVIADWVARAKEIANILSAIEGIIVNPNPPQVSFFQLFIKGDHEVLTKRHNQLAETEGSFVFSRLRQAPVPGYAMTEIHIFENGMSFDETRLAAFMTSLLSDSLIR
jgi:threonine aldolase